MSRWTITQWFTCGILLLGLCVIAYLSAQGDLKAGLLISFAPIIIIFFAAILTNPYWGLMTLFVLNYFIMGISRYVTTSSLGVTTDIVIMLTIVSFLYQSAFKGDISWFRIKNNFLIKAFAVWVIFCIVEVLNPTGVFQAWLSNIRSYAIYPFFTLLFTTILFHRFKDLKTILFLWSLFSFLAFAKVIMQQYWGWDYAEIEWLKEGARTHILSTGIRYFSFFTDAGNFGSNMGCSMVVFSICAFFTKSKGLRIYYFIVALTSAYGMFVSGTRGALAVPFAGYLLYILLSKNFKTITAISIFVLFIYVFLNFTYIGQSNQYIRRMRTAFDENDASLLVRKQNQKTLATYMKTRPFGEGLGLSGAEAERYAPGRITTLPNDSWFVKVWVETGIAGLCFHIALLALSIGFGIYIILARIRNKELRGYLSAMLCGFAGILASAYGNAIFLQYPTGIIMYMIQAFLFMGLSMDKQIESENPALEDGE